jgi:hypothetical protein
MYSVAQIYKINISMARISGKFDIVNYSLTYHEATKIDSLSV